MKLKVYPGKRALESGGFSTNIWDNRAVDGVNLNVRAGSIEESLVCRAEKPDNLHYINTISDLVTAFRNLTSFGNIAMHAYMRRTLISKK